MQIAQQILLHQVDREDEHDSRAQRRQYRGGLIAGPVEIGEAVAQRRRQVQTRAIQQEAQSAQSATAASTSKTTSVMVNSNANHAPTLGESESAQAMPPSAATTAAAMPSCSRRAHQRANQPPMPVGPCSTSLRSTRTGRTARTSSSGGRQKSSVVSRPVPRPASADCQGN